MGDLYKKNTCLDFPKGGNEALVDALVRGIEKHPGRVTINMADRDHIKSMSDLVDFVFDELFFIQQIMKIKYIFRRCFAEALEEE